MIQLTSLKNIALWGLAVLISYGASAQDNRIKVMTYNVENLFDRQHDEGKLDYTYLPMSVKRGQMRDEVNAYCRGISSKHWRWECENFDWSPTVTDFKMQQIADVVLQVEGYQGTQVGPDLLVLQEVENANILSELLEGPLLEGDYYGAIVDAGDKRGIDTAVVSRLPFIQEEPPRMHWVSAEGLPDEDYRMRGILESNLLLPDGTAITVLSLHFPSPGHNRVYRERNLETLNEIKASLPHGRVILAGGDSNITSYEEWKYSPIERIAKDHWQVVDEYCTDCLGSYYYARYDEWSFLDRFFLGRNTQTVGQKQWKLDQDSVAVVNTAIGQVDADGYPIRFTAHPHDQLGGFSDHLPLVFDLYK